jgi:putative ABC transport system permease protein
LTQTAPARLEDWNRLNQTFQALTGFYAEEVSETSGELPEKLTQAWVGPRFLEVWGIPPAVGRDFTSEEWREGGPSAVLISDGFWRRRFAADPGAIGRQLRIGAFSPTIVGVMPATFQFPVRDADVWWPFSVSGMWAQPRMAGGDGPFHSRPAETRRVRRAGPGRPGDRAEPAGEGVSEYRRRGCRRPAAV